MQDLAAVLLPQPTLLMLTHEDRAVDRQQLFVAGLDSVVLALRASATGSLPFADPGPGQRVSLTLSEHQPPLAKLDALVVSPQTGKLALVVIGHRQPVSDLARRTASVCTSAWSTAASRSGNRT